MRSSSYIACLIGVLLAATAVRPTFAQQSSATQRPTNQPETHVVQEGETLWSIAQRYDKTVATLRRLNDLKGNLIRRGQTLIVSRPDASPPSPTSQPAPERSAPSTSADPTSPLPDREYVVQRGETLFSIADRYGISADTLWRLNDRPTAPLDSGRVLRLPSGIRGTHRVRSGETLSRIARDHDVSLQALRRANPDLRGNTIYAGQVLRLPASAEGVSMQARQDTLIGPVQRYPDAFAGRLTASGSTYDPDAYTASHSTLPLGTVVLLTNPATGRRSFAVVNDRGPLNPDYLMEVSDAVLRKLHLAPRSDQPIHLRIVERGRTEE